MSHYSVMVIHQEDENVGDLLMPFYEEAQEGDEYAEFEVLVEKGKEEEYQEKELGDNKYWKDKLDDLEEYKEMSAEEFIKKYSGYSRDKNGNWGYWYNPQGRWDWYVVGGRWRNLLKLKAGAEYLSRAENDLFQKEYKPKEGWCDSAKVSNIDWEGMSSNARVQAELHWQKAVELRNRLTKEGKKEEEISKELNWNFGVGAKMTKEEYLKQEDNIGCWAVLKDGEWVETGTMAWWGMTNATDKQKNDWDASFYDKFIKQLVGNEVITIVDCHM